MEVWDQPLVVGKTDVYTATVDPDWLGTEPLSTATATATNGLATIDNIDFTPEGVMAVTVTGVGPGYELVHFDWETATRSGCGVANLQLNADCS